MATRTQLPEPSLAELVEEGAEVLRQQRAMPPRRLAGPALVEALCDAAGADDAALDRIEEQLADRPAAAATVSRLSKTIREGRVGEAPSSAKAQQLLRSLGPEQAAAELAAIGASVFAILAVATRRVADRLTDGTDSLEGWDREQAAHAASLAEIYSAMRDAARLSDLEDVPLPTATSFSERDHAPGLRFKQWPSVRFSIRSDWPEALCRGTAFGFAPQPEPKPADAEPEATRMEKIADAVREDGDAALNVSPVRRHFLDEYVEQAR